MVRLKDAWQPLPGSPSGSIINSSSGGESQGQGSAGLVGQQQLDGEAVSARGRAALVEALAGAAQAALPGWEVQVGGRLLGVLSFVGLVHPSGCEVPEPT